VYLAASTFFGFSSHALGLALPFTFYTGMSTTISALLGPVGMAVVAFPTAFEMVRAKPGRLIGAVTLIASWRAKLAEEQNQEKRKRFTQKTFWVAVGIGVSLITSALVAYSILNR